MKNTPGPWKIARDESGMIKGVEAAKWWICDTQFIGIKECEANAKLIAAAPELLQSCINILSELSVEADSQLEGYSHIVQDALKAIKKATL